MSVREHRLETSSVAAEPGVAYPGQVPERRRVVSIRFIVTAVAVALVSGGVLGVGWVGERHVRNVLATEVEARLLMAARNLARSSASALLSDFPELALHPAVREIQEDHPELAFVVVVDHEDKIQGHANARSLDETFAPPADLVAVPTTHRLWPNESISKNSATLVARVPVRHPSGASIGTVYVGLQRSHVEAAATAARQQQAVVLMVLLVLAVASTLVLMATLLRPIDRLRAGLERIGHGDLDTPIVLRDRTEFQLLADSINTMAGALSKAQEQMMEKERLKHEMELARQVQNSLLPAHSIVSGDFEILGVHQAAAEVGGDYFDILELPDGRIGIAIADVSGKGLAGCLVMSMVAVLLRSLRRSHRTPSALLAALDDQLSGNLRPGVFVTMFYGILDPSSGRLCYASAGHSPVLVHRAATQATEWHYTEAIPVGAVRGALGATLRDYELELQPGDTLVQFTDGVNEAWEPGTLQQFGFGRLEQVVKNTAAGGSRAVITAVRRALGQWTQDTPRLDDETLVVVHRLSAGASMSATGIPGAQPSRAIPGSSELLIERAWSLRDGGRHLEMRRDAGALHRLRPWLATCPELTALADRDSVLLEHALHELCANILEHGYRDHAVEGHRDPALDLWWIPDADLWSGQTPRDPNRFAGQRQLLQNLQRGVFLVCDRGKAFSPSVRRAEDLDDPMVRKRGRGLGLRIIQEVMHPLLYRDGTAHGNITLMRFDPVEQSAQEVRNVSTKP